MKRIYRRMLFLSPLVLLVALFIFHQTIPSDAAAPKPNERSEVTPILDRVVNGIWREPHPSSHKLLNSSYLLQGGGSIPTTYLVGEWRFDEASGVSTADSSGKGGNATLQNGPVWSGGRYRAGLRFDGSNDYVQVGALPALVMGNVMSIGAWIYP